MTFSFSTLQKIIQWSGIASLFFYGGAIFITNHQTPTGYMIGATAGLVGAAYGVYVALWYAIRHVSWDDSARGWALGLGVALVCAGACIVPPAKTDVYHYVVEDRIWVVQKENPFTTSPSMVATVDPLVQLSHWQNLTTQHGPLRLLLSAPGTLLGGGSLVGALIWYRMLLVVSIAVSAYAIYQLTSSVSRDWATTATVLLLWNPLIVFEVFYNGGTDIIMMAFFLVSVLLSTRSKSFSAAAFFIASVLVKYITILALPIFLLHMFFTASTRRAGVVRCVGSLVIMTLIAVAAYAPFWEGPVIFDSLLWVASVVESNSLAGFFAAMGMVAVPAFSVGAMATISLVIFVLGCLGVGVYALTPQGRISLARSGAARYHVYIFGLFVVFGKTWLYPKYMLWVMPLLLIHPATASVAVVVSGLATTAMFDPGFIVLGLVPAVVVWAVGHHLLYRHHLS